MKLLLLQRLCITAGSSLLNSCLCVLMVNILPISLYEESLLAAAVFSDRSHRDNPEKENPKKDQSMTIFGWIDFEGTPIHFTPFSGYLSVNPHTDSGK